MAGLIPQDFIDDLIARADVVEVIGKRIQRAAPALLSLPPTLANQRRASVEQFAKANRQDRADNEKAEIAAQEP